MPRGVRRRHPTSRPLPPLEPPPDPRADHRTLAEARQQATSWEEWGDAAPGVGRYGARIDAPPWALQWQRNPHGQIPPGYVRARCLCFAFLVRPRSWHGQGRNRNGALVRSIGPAVTIGDLCEQCEAPIQEIRRWSDPYVIDLSDLPPQPGARAFWQARGLEVWAFGNAAPVRPAD